MGLLPFCGSSDRTAKLEIQGVSEVMTVVGVFQKPM